MLFESLESEFLIFEGFPLNGGYGTFVVRKIAATHLSIEY